MKTMNFKFITAFFLLMAQSCMTMMPAYNNVITDIQAIQGATTYTLILSCDQLEPIIVYAPASYQEHSNKESLTFFMPNTVFKQGVEEIPGVLESINSGVAIFLVGKLKKKVVADHKIYIVIEVVQ